MTMIDTEDETMCTTTRRRLEPRQLTASPSGGTSIDGDQHRPATPQQDANSPDGEMSPVAPMNPFDSPKRSSGMISSTASSPSLQIIADLSEAEVATLTPTRTRSRSVTFLASGCGVSPLNPFDSPLRTTFSPIRTDLEIASLHKELEMTDDGLRQSMSMPSPRSLGSSSPGNSVQNHDKSKTEEDMIMGLKPVRRHTISGGKPRSSHDDIQSNQLKDITEDLATQRSTTSSQETIHITNINEGSNNNNSNNSEDTNSAYPNQYRYYCICSQLFMSILRRLCRPHVNRPSFLHCPNNSKLQPHHQRMLCRSLIIIFMIITITFTLLDLLILHQYLHVWLEGGLDWLASRPVAGGLVFIAIILLASLCFFPVSLLALGAGYVYIDLYGLGLGLVAAFMVCYTGCLLGAAICFARSRYLMRQLIKKFANRYPIVRAVDRAFGRMGFRLFLLLRLSPAMPFNALNYIGGITAVRFKDYWRATCIGILPGLLWTIFVGATFGTINARGVDGNQEFDRDSVRKGVVLGLGIGLGVMGLIGTGIYARQELTKIILAEQAAEQQEQQQRLSEAETSMMAEEVAALAQQRNSNENLFLSMQQRQDSNLSGLSLNDLENPQLGESYGDHDDAESNREPFLDNSEVSLRSNSFVEQRRENNPVRDVPWSPEAIALELPIVPNIFRRRVVSCEFIESPVNNNDRKNTSTDNNGHSNYEDVTTNSNSPTTDSKPSELHTGEQPLDEIPYEWEKGNNNRYHFVKGPNRPRCNTDPISTHTTILQTDTSLEERRDGTNNYNNKVGDACIRRLHSMADFESFRETVLAGGHVSSSPGVASRDEEEGGLDREWFWIWD